MRPSTAAAFIRVLGSELVQRYIGQGAHLVREIFALARTKKACIIFFDEIDAFAATRHGGRVRSIRHPGYHAIIHIRSLHSFLCQHNLSY